MTDLALAVDIGGTKMAAGLVDRSGALLHGAQVPTPQAGAHDGPASGGGPEQLWDTLAGLVEQVRTQAEGLGQPVVCGAGAGGPMSLGGETISPLNIGGWRAFPLRARLADLTGLPSYVDNDAKALALGEGWVGAAAGERNFIAMVVSTGVGGGIVLDGRLLEGRLGNAGHIGHVIVVPEGRPCACGGQGCLEAEASGLAVSTITGQRTELAPPEVVERTGTLVGRAVASVVNLLDLPLAVVSGSVALGFGHPFFAAAQREMDFRCRLDFARGARIEPGGLGDRGPLIGAARVGWLGLGHVR
ncbi:MAG TPA: ROK family protein [Acidimicrobiales bacterium]